MNISKQDAEQKLRESAIMDWKEDWQHLQNQLQRDQVGSLGGHDKIQKKRDDRALKVRDARKNAVEKSNLEVSKLMEKEGLADVKVEDAGAGDEDFVIKDREKRAKIDVMGAVSNTGDRLGLSVRQKAMFAASVVKAVGVYVQDTNISFSTAKKKDKKSRFETEKRVLNEFVPPDHLVLHWDGKMLKLKAGAKAEFICVYISGANTDRVTKLLGVPEVGSGSGKDQKEVVVQMLKKWKIFEQIAGLVFDTTSSNTGNEIGACKLLEEYLEKAVLWLACRHHIYELHIKHVVEAITGNTKDPGVKLYRRLRAEWPRLSKDSTNLKKFDYTNSNPWLCKQAREVLSWAEEHWRKGTWPRDDYRELLELVIIWLGGEIESFTFKFPGADHHARWLSKAIYDVKIDLLSNQFIMEDKEQVEVAVIAEFVCLFYAKAFFCCPLPAAAPRCYLEFMSNILKYRLMQPRLAYHCL